MNPSSSGWIDKYIFSLQKDAAVFSNFHPDEYYAAIRNTGFIYGHSVVTVYDKIDSEYTLTQDELAKVNLLHSLMGIYFYCHPQSDFEKCTETIFRFYNKLLPRKKGFLNRIKFKIKRNIHLEKIISKRVSKINITENQPFEKIMTDALLFMDIVVFHNFLKGKTDLHAFVESLEYQIIYNCFLALNSKKNKTKDDLQLIELFKQSELYFDNRSVNYNLLQESYAKKYLLDLTALGVWNDLHLEKDEKHFLENLADQLHLGQNTVEEASESLQNFVKQHAVYLRLFQHKNPVKELYKESTQVVKLLILRNKKRLSKELEKNKELMLLLGKSTYATLSYEEKLSVKNQFMEIAKTVPSLAIFILPGGSLLLPLLVKFIPEILPNTFRDNQIPKK